MRGLQRRARLGLAVAAAMLTIALAALVARSLVRDPDVNVRDDARRTAPLPSALNGAPRNPSSARVRGRAVDSSGAALPATRIIASSGGRESTGAATADGRFELTLPALGRWLVHASAGRRTHTSEIMLEADMDVGDLVLRDEVSVRGTVVDSAGRVLSRARVVACRAPAPASFRSTRGDARAVLSCVESGGAGDFHLRLERDQWIVVSAESADREDLAESGTWLLEEDLMGLRLVAGRAARVVGRVIDRDGQPISGASVALTPSASSYSFALIGTPTTTTDSNGRFDARVAGGRFDLHIGAAGFVSIRRTRLDAPVDLGDVRLQGEAEAELLVVDAQGRGVSGATVLATSDSQRTQWHGTSDVNGRCTIRGLGRGDTVRVSVDGGPNGLAGGRTFRIEADAPLVVRLGRLRRIRGRVIDAATGRGIGDAAVLARPLPSILQGESPARRAADGAGAFELQVSCAEAVDLVAEAPGWVSSPWNKPETRVLLDAASDAITLRMERGTPLSGRVVTPSGDAAVGATVRLAVSGADGDDSVYFAPGAATMTNERGEFRLPHAPPIGAVPEPLVVAVLDGYRPGVARRGAADGVVVALEPAHELRGTVVRPDGSPIAGAYVGVGPLEPMGGAIAVDRPTFRSTSEGGQFSIVVPRSGEYTLLASAGGHVRRSVRCRSGVDNAVRLERASTLLGSVVDGAGSPVASARVTCRSAAQGGSWDETQTDWTGRYVLQMPAGEASIDVWALGYEPLELKIVVGEDRTLPPFTLSSGTSVSGSIIVPSDYDTSCVTVRARQVGPDGPEVRFGEVFADGRFKISGLRESARITIEAAAPTLEFPSAEAAPGDADIRIHARPSEGGTR